MVWICGSSAAQTGGDGVPKRAGWSARGVKRSGTTPSADGSAAERDGEHVLLFNVRRPQESARRGWSRGPIGPYGHT
ncbi:MAG: hypothetical protein D6725_02155 [Planctomycetota bacterium]|nr:MAG: hypothetical protein D6725_02155 [Planctomycetota bacterium]